MGTRVWIPSTQTSMPATCNPSSWASWLAWVAGIARLSKARDPISTNKVENNQGRRWPSTCGHLVCILTRTWVCWCAWGVGGGVWGVSLSSCHVSPDWIQIRLRDKYQLKVLALSLCLSLNVCLSQHYFNLPLSVLKITTKTGSLIWHRVLSFGREKRKI